MFCAARRKTRAKRAEIRSAQQKRPCQPKTAKRFFGGPASQGPSGQAKEQTRILPVRRGFSAPGVPRHMAGWSLFRSLLLSGLLAFVLGVSAFFLSVFRCLVPGLWVVRRFLFGLRCLLAVWPSSALFPACRQPAAFVQTFAPTALFARRALCVRSSVLFWLSVRPFCAVCAAFLSYLSPFPA